MARAPPRLLLLSPHPLPDMSEPDPPRPLLLDGNPKPRGRTSGRRRTPGRSPGAARACRLARLESKSKCSRTTCRSHPPSGSVSLPPHEAQQLGRPCYYARSERGRLLRPPRPDLSTTVGASRHARKGLTVVLLFRSHGIAGRPVVLLQTANSSGVDLLRLGLAARVAACMFHLARSDVPSKMSSAGRAKEGT